MIHHSPSDAENDDLHFQFPLLISCDIMRSLSADEKLQFERDGYLVIRNFFSTQTAATLLEKSQKLIREFDLEGHPLTTFVTDKVDQVSCVL